MQTPIIDPAKRLLVAAALPHVAFDGWSAQVFDAAVAEVGMAPDAARALCPRGAVDLAIGFHQMGDAAMADAMAEADLSALRYRDKVAFAIRARLKAVPDKEAVRRGTALFALPHLAADGARLIWGTADRIWTALGDTSDDVNWYTKRATLSAVYASVVLYWLGDNSPDGQATRDFIDRRIDDVMQIEKAKARIRNAPLLKPLTGALGRLLEKVRPPGREPPADLPGHWSPSQTDR